MCNSGYQSYAETPAKSVRKIYSCRRRVHVLHLFTGMNFFTTCTSISAVQIRAVFTPKTIRVSVGKLRPVWVQAFEFLDNERTQFSDQHQLGIFAHRMRVFSLRKLRPVRP